MQNLHQFDSNLPQGSNFCFLSDCILMNLIIDKNLPDSVSIPKQALKKMVANLSPSHCPHSSSQASACPRPSRRRFERLSVCRTLTPGILYRFWFPCHCKFLTSSPAYEPMRVAGRGLVIKNKNLKNQFHSS